mgnify:CR=1 FL=1
MKYYRVKKECDGVTVCKCVHGQYAHPIRLVGYELFTERELKHMKNTCVMGTDGLNAFEEVEVNKNNTWKQRGHRFEYIRMPN